MDDSSGFPTVVAGHKSVSGRRATFHSWPESACVGADELSRAGFIYTGTLDHVKCPFCNGTLGKWQPGDQALEEHRRHFPTCPFIININAASGLYTTGTARRESFDNWPETAMIAPDKLYRAGFFYLGISDHVQCAFCNGKLGKWQPGDDALREHQRHFPTCPFIKSSIDMEQPGSTENKQVNVQSLANISVIDQVISFGFERELVQEALKHEIKTTGRGCTSANELLDVVLQYQDNPAMDSNTENRDGSKNMECKVCMDREAKVAFQPCGHFACCKECASQLDNCPICRTLIDDFVTIYFP